MISGQGRGLGGKLPPLMAAKGKPCLAPCSSRSFQPLGGDWEEVEGMGHFHQIE